MNKEQWMQIYEAIGHCEARIETGTTTIQAFDWLVEEIVDIEKHDKGV